MLKSHNSVRLIAFYLPQYHPIPENDQCWGKGFTEWRNVVKAKPLFPGHYQPQLPADLGFYDLRLPEVRQAQAELARGYGIHGFCYYHYWFHGRPLLHRPFDEVLNSGSPDFPFCLCWANEHWTRAWDGNSRQIVMEQIYSHEDDRAHIRSLLAAFRDQRYIRINGRPLFLVYRPEEMPRPQQTTEIWREEVMAAGIGDLYLAKVDSFTSDIDPHAFGFDATVEFAPDWHNVGSLKYRANPYRLLSSMGLITDFYQKNHVAKYEGMVQRMLKKEWPSYTFFRCVTPGFDNTARRSEGAVVFLDSTPEKYETWLREIVERTVRIYRGDERVVFVNAWNEWAEGNHLEPDQKHGLAFLEATYRGLVNGADCSASAATGSDSRSKNFGAARKLYWRSNKMSRDLGHILKHFTFRSS